MRLTVLFALLFFLSACGEPAYVEPSPGQTVFLNNCVGCHAGSGNPPGPNGIILMSLQTNDLEKFRAYLRHPTHSMMPSFSPSQLSDADVDLLYGYLQELKAGNNSPRN